MNIIDEIKLKSGLSDEEINSKIDEKKTKFKDLLNNETAAFLIAKEQGIEIDDSNINLVPLNLVDENTKNANILVNVKRIFPKKEYTHKDKKGTLQTIIVYDKTTELSLTLWNQEFEPKPGDIVLVKNVYASKNDYGLKLNTSFLSEIKVKGHKEIVSENKKIKDVELGDFDINVEGVLIRKNEIRHFDYNGSQRAVIRFSLFEEGSFISVVAWGDLAEKLDKVNENTLVKINSVFVKENRGRKEVHLRDVSTYTILKENVEVNTDAPEKAITELAYDERSKIKVKLKELIRSYVADSCATCGTRMEMKEGRFFCSKCNDFKEVKKKIVTAFLIEDESGTTNAVFFTNSAKILLDADDENIEDKIAGFKPANALISLVGYLKKTDYADEFMVSRVYK